MTRPPHPLVRQLPLELHRNEGRVIPRMFAIYGETRFHFLVQRICELSDELVAGTLNQVFSLFRERHKDLRTVFIEHFELVAELADYTGDLDENRRLLVGSYFTMEYSLEAAALFNPSIVKHPCQDGLEPNACRFVMSLRATGEGHISSVVFRTGTIQGNDAITLDPPARFSVHAKRMPDQFFLKPLFLRKLTEMSVNKSHAEQMLASLPERFIYSELKAAVEQTVGAFSQETGITETVECIYWLAQSNYQVRMPEDADISDIVLFPQSESEARGIEDVRLVQFTDDDGAQTYYGTYTAFNGTHILPMLLETSDFKDIQIHTLNGPCARDKGMALFPKRVNGHYAMCSRIDGRNLYMMYSDYVHFWESAVLLAEPEYPWELTIIGNCGAPLETDEGWLLLTHGVGPMRQYCIGAMLLDLEDPTRIIGRLREPLLFTREEEREGYVPNVVYTCGAMQHEGILYIPYAMADRYTSMASVDMDALLTCLRNGNGKGINA